MSFDLNTLFLVTIYVEAILGLLLLFAWVQNPGISAVAWWGSAHLVRALSTVLFGLHGAASQAIPTDLADGLLLFSYAVIWAGARVFDGRKPLAVLLVLGPLVWLVAATLPPLAGVLDLPALLASIVIATCTWLTAFEFWRGRGEPLVSRWPAIFMLVAHGFFLLLLRTPLAAMLPWAPTQGVFDSVWPSVLSFEALLFTIAIAFILLAMAKERTAYRHRTEAMVDPLTGVANRRSFLTDAEALTKRTAAAPYPTAVLLIDLDQFKSINDRFGHAVGDRVLQIFADSTMGVIRQSDLLGRLGGEEFAAVLHNVHRDKAVALAEQIRCAFADATAEVDGCAVGATLSIGVVLHQGAPLDVPELLVQADHALYCAKKRGRNRVEITSFDLRKHSESGSPQLAIAKRMA